MFVVLHLWDITLIIFTQLSSRITLLYIFLISNFKITKHFLKSLQVQKQTFIRPKAPELFFSHDRFEHQHWTSTDGIHFFLFHVCVSQMGISSLLQRNINQKHSSANSPTWPCLCTKLRPAVLTSRYGVLLLHTNVAATKIHCASRGGKHGQSLYHRVKTQPPIIR